MYTKVAENWLEDRLDPLQKEFLQKTLDYYEIFTRQAAKEPEVRLEHGRTYQRMGDIHRKFGRTAESAAAYHRALGILEPLMKEAPGDPEVRRALAVTRSHLGDLFARRNLNDEAAVLYKQAEDLLSPLAFPPDAAAATRRSLAACPDTPRQGRAAAPSGRHQDRPANGFACLRALRAGSCRRAAKYRVSERPRTGERLSGPNPPRIRRHERG